MMTKSDIHLHSESTCTLMIPKACEWTATNTIFKFRTMLKKSIALGAFWIPLLLCSCTTEDSIRSQLPRDVAMNKDAGGGQLLFVMLRLDSGEELPFVVDTGAAATLLDKSLVPKLGKRLGQVTIWRFGEKAESDLYAAPKLYLGNTPLMITGGGVVDYDFKQLSSSSGRPIMGVLGMDCLENYCIQLDFIAGKMRFLDAKHSSKKSWGKPFSLTDTGDGRAFIRENLVGLKDLGTPATLIDTGWDSAGWLATNLFQQWTNHAKPPANGEVRAPNAVLGGETYSDLLSVAENGDSNGIGLWFLSQHLVTFDFPNRTMYLKRTRPPKLRGYKGAEEFLILWMKEGRLPGWSKSDTGTLVGASLVGTNMIDLTGVVFKIRKQGDSTFHQYKIARSSEKAPWKLEKAWRTDLNDRSIEEYPPR
ncbi:MAG: hypothetical protein JWR26_617 [Pedosphaera sp.]|nr:hypothetical protein [Pedosphaera sp.]